METLPFAHSSPAMAPPENGGPGRVAPRLMGVSETMLWSLYNRARESTRPDRILADPDSELILDALDYDFHGHFGEPMGLLAVRAAEIDRVLRQWLGRHPCGIVISLGEGLETQARRVDNGKMRWLSVDLPRAIGLREQFLGPTHRFRHLAVSALDPGWMDAVDPSDHVFIVAQGLLMYLEPESVGGLLTMIAARFSKAEIVFDAIPRWFSRMTMRGVQQTRSYRLPAMPWGINRDEIGPALRMWHPEFTRFTFLDYRMPRGIPRLLDTMTAQIAVARQEVPCLVHVMPA